ncbi:MAG: hypothetical protein LBK59_03780 [Bifidobacteriaceae bacterium]|nr:hypothetical protein [Bifidobacteriaceae bacterium]
MLPAPLRTTRKTNSAAAPEWKTDGVRVYIPLTVPRLAEPDIAAPTAFAPTAGLAVELPGEDTEVVEYAAFLAAADASLAGLAGSIAPPRRVVVSADVPDADLAPPQWSDPHPGAVVLTRRVMWAAVAAIHIDEPDAADDVRLAIAADPAAALRVEERDLLWYAPQERSAILAGL